MNSINKLINSLFVADCGPQDAASATDEGDTTQSTMQQKANKSKKGKGKKKKNQGNRIFSQT